jgi:CBS domain containing-hemolysin-like protein
VALAFAGSLYWLMKLLKPIAGFFDGISEWICQFFKVQEEPTITEDELAEMIDSLAETEEDGQQRSELLQSALKFDDAVARDVMTPLEDVVGIEWKMSPETITDIIKQTNLSRLPVYKGRKENIVGILHIRNYIKHQLTHPAPKAIPLSKLMRKAMLVDGSKPIDTLFDEMTQSRTHMCAVKDNDGTVIGIVTMEDILEQLVGEIWDEYDIVPPEQEETV